MASHDALQTNSAPSPASGTLSRRDTDPAHPWMPSTALASLPTYSQPPKDKPTSPLAFFHLLERLKTTKREGWRRFGIDHGESISDHMYRMSILTMLAPPALSRSLDIARCTKMALVHDMAELLVGDITPVDNMTKAEKNRRESITMDYLCDELLGNVDGGAQAKDIRAAWQEYEDSKTQESLFVHDIDKMELILQMVEYEKADVTKRANAELKNAQLKNGELKTTREPLNLGEFTWVAQKIQCEEVKRWAKDVLEERKAFWQERFGLGVEQHTVAT